MQTLANMSGTDAVRRQYEVNQDSLSRLCSYYDGYKKTLVLQMKSHERVANRKRTVASVVTKPPELKGLAARPTFSKASSVSSFLSRKASGTYLLYPRTDGSACPVDSSLGAANAEPDDQKAELLVSYIDR